MKELSVIIPVYFSQDTIVSLVTQLQKELVKYLKDFEIVLVNDGSTDRSDELCTGLAAKSRGKIVYACLAKNFTEHNAVMAGLNLCSGKYAVIIDDDFQNPPSEIFKMYQKIKKSNVLVVYSYYAEKKHHWFRNLGSKFNNDVATTVLNKPSHLYLSSFKILARVLIDEIIKYKGPFPYIDGLILRATNRIETQLVEHKERKVGRSNYTLRKLIKLWSNMFINFSLKPLRLTLYLGCFSSVMGFIMVVTTIVEKIQNPGLPLGWASLMSGILISAGVQLLVLGIIGEFLGRMFMLSTNTPQYVISKIVKG